MAVIFDLKIDSVVGFSAAQGQAVAHTVGCFLTYALEVLSMKVVLWTVVVLSLCRLEGVESAPKDPPTTPVTSTAPPSATTTEDESARLVVRRRARRFCLL